MAMSDAHKAALAEGRRQSSAIKKYLAATTSRKRGRPVTPESMRSRIARVEAKLATESDPLKRVDLYQSKINAQMALDQSQDTADLAALEAGFVAHARAYSERKGISYAAWREAGVAATVLKSAGISRST